MKQIIQKILIQFGYVLVKNTLYNQQKKYYRDRERHLNLLNLLNFETIIDVGGHEGGFAESMFKTGFLGKMVSIEPVAESYNKLNAKSRYNINWDTYKLAIGNNNEKTTINISENFVSSSLLDVNIDHVNAEQSSQYIKSEEVQVKRLDTFLEEVSINCSTTMLKIDTQGYEMQVLEGLGEKIKSLKAIKLELSNKHLYKNSKLYFEISQFLYSHNYELISIENGFYDKKNYRLLQFDGLFLNKVYDPN